MQEQASGEDDYGSSRGRRRGRKESFDEDFEEDVLEEEEEEEEEDADAALARQLNEELNGLRTRRPRAQQVGGSGLQRHCCRAADDRHPCSRSSMQDRGGNHRGFMLALVSCCGTAVPLVGKPNVCDSTVCACCQVQGLIAHALLLLLLSFPQGTPTAAGASGRAARSTGRRTGAGAASSSGRRSSSMRSTAVAVKRKAPSRATRGASRPNYAEDDDTDSDAEYERQKKARREAVPALDDGPPEDEEDGIEKVLGYQ